MSTFQPHDYGPRLAGVLQADRNRALGPGTPDLSMEAALGDLTVENAFAHTSVRDREMAELCLAGVWLLHDFLDTSHTISQGVSTSSGSYWHAIMHRREPDYSNAKYWFRRVGDHPVYEELAAAMHELAGDATLDDTAAEVVAGNAWDPMAFVDLCQDAAQGRSANTELCRAIQQRECELLLDFCYRQATG